MKIECHYPIFVLKKAVRKHLMEVIVLLFFSFPNIC